jgi:hypothetical protein
VNGFIERVAVRSKETALSRDPRTNGVSLAEEVARRAVRLAVR